MDGDSQYIEDENLPSALSTVFPNEENGCSSSGPKHSSVINSMIASFETNDFKRWSSSDDLLDSDTDGIESNISGSKCETNDSILQNSDSEEETFEEVSINGSSCSVSALADSQSDLNYFSFSGDPGMKCNSRGLSTPYDFFCLFADDDFYALLVNETNSHAKHVFQNHTRHRLRMGEWEELSVPELKTFLGLLLHMGHIKLPRLSDYWKTDQLFDLKCFSKQMNMKRFLAILKCLYFCKSPKPEEVSKDKVYKIKCLQNHFNLRMDSIYYPDKDLIIDEPLILSKGHLISQQCIKSRGKMEKYVLKVYQLVEASGLVLRSLVYCEEMNDSCELSHSDNIVLNLMDGKLGKGHSLYMDSFFNSYYLASLLLANETYCTGSLPDIKDNNPEGITPKLKNNENGLFNGVQITKWQDKRYLFVASKELQNEMVDVQYRKSNPCKPLAVVRYNQFMTRSDRKDSILAFYPCEKENLHWYVKLGIYYIQMMMLNSYYLFRKCFLTTIKYYDFRLEVIRELLSMPSQFLIHKRLTPTKRPLQEDLHVPCKLKINKAGKTMRKRCRVCLKEGKRKDTRFFCQGCPLKPALCVENCFKKYHTE